MELQPYAAFKVLLFFVVVPLCALALYASKRWLQPSNPVRAWLERRAILKVATVTLFVTAAVAGVVITLAYS
jgi:hypothetical protein